MWIDLKFARVKTVCVKGLKLFGLALLLLAPLLPARAQFTFITNNSAVIITQYTGTDSEVVIPSTTNGWPVRVIGYSAFQDNANLTSVSIPNTVVDIRDSAFFGCSSLATLTIPASVTNLGFQVFTESGLKNMVIPGSVVNVGVSAFLNCFNLTNVTLSNGVALLGYDAFYGCSNLTTVSIPASCTNVQDEAFAQCYSLTNLTVDAANSVFSSLGGVMFNKAQTELFLYPPGLVGSYAISNGVTSIGNSAFNLCQNLTGINMPDSLTNIGSSAFNGCAGLTNILIPTNVVEIGAGAFSGTSITNILIPKSVTKIGTTPFAYCSGLIAIKVDTNNPTYRSVGGVLFSFNQTCLIEFPIGQGGSFLKPGSYSVPPGTTSVGDQAFMDCYYLTNVTLPNGLGRIGNFAFDECARLVTLKIPDTVTNIGDFAFSGTSLTNLTIPSAVTTLGALGYWTNLRSLYFLGNAPSRSNGNYVILPLQNAKAYYLPGTTGWDTFSQTLELSTALWLPQSSGDAGHFGLSSNQFSFSINWAPGQTVIVEACTNLFSPNWQPVQTNTLADGSAFFSDPKWTNSSARFYRLRSPQ